MVEAQYIQRNVSSNFRVFASSRVVEMTEPQIKQLLKLLGARNPRRQGKFIQCSCLFARFFHRGGTDHRPSFGMRIGSGHFSCFACDRRGSPVTLVSSLRLLGVSVPLDAERLASDWILTWDREVEKDLSENTEPADVKVLKPFPLAWTTKSSREYLAKKRKIFGRIATEYDLRYDPERERILFPAFDAENKFWGAAGRSISGGLPPYLNYWMEDRRRFALLGESLWKTRSGPIVLVEGPIDVLHVAQAGRTVLPLSTFGASVSYDQLQKIAALACSKKRMVYLWPDNDEGGEAMLYKVGNWLRNLVPVKLLKYPVGCKAKDPAGMLSVSSNANMSLTDQLKEARLL